MTMKNNEEKKSTIRVLLADDHAVVRAGIRQFLERAGDIQVIGEASDGEMAVEMIERMAPDVAVLDIQSFLAKIQPVRFLTSPIKASQNAW